MTRLELAVAIETMCLVTDQRTLVNQAVQIALNRVYEWFDWPYYMKEGVIQTIAKYTTGTAKVTNGSTTITGVGTTWTAAMVGRKFRHSNESAYYVISAYVSATQLTLRDSYQGSTDSTGSTYTIYKDEYRLSADVDKYKTIRQIQNGIPLLSIAPTKFDRILPTPQSYTDPIIEVNIGTKLDTYTTGTVSAIAASNTITGASTSWTSVEGLGRMSQIRIANDVYTVKSVDSDTQITTFEAIVTTASAGASYEITLRNLVVQLYNIPDAQRNLYYRYFRLADVLANNYDIPDMPIGWHWLLIYGGLSFMFLQKGDINKSQIESETRFLDGLGMMRVKLGSFASDRIYRKKSIEISSRIGDGLELPTFDRKYSSF